ncbi:MAG: FAD/NAD(P)-binding protein [Desulfobacterales bacterium]|nr:FAD/NAD(P)-binding protein [Desulfobacterales bacterium]
MTINHTIENSYLPRPARISEVIEENSRIKTFVLSFADQELNRSFSYRPGQFMMVSIPHCGEAPISFSSTPSRPGTIQLSVRRAGRLTDAMHQLGTGAMVGLRGPFGRPFPLDRIIGRDLLFVAGGIGLAPLRSVINYCLDQDNSYGRLTILYGSRTPDDIAFKRDLDLWRQHPRATCLLTVDQTRPGWDGPVGVVTGLLDAIEVTPANTVALVCGPPLMIRFVLARLSRIGLKEKNIITTLERQMKCGLGICGHCHMDGQLVCVDGPVYTMAQLLELDVMELHP